MSSLIINGEKRFFDKMPTLAELARAHTQSSRVAIAVNGDFVPRVQYADFVLEEDDEVEIVAPMQGG